MNVKCNAGKAWVELGVCLGYPLDLPPPQLYQDDHGGNSCDRRQNRRAAERVAKETKESVENDDEVENKDKESGKNSKNETKMVTKLLNKDEKLNPAEKDAFQDMSSKQDNGNDEEVCHTVAEEASNDASDNCKQAYEFNRDVRYSTCDKCILN